MAFIAFSKGVRVLRWMATPLVACIEIILNDDDVHDVLKIVLVLVLLCYGLRSVLGVIAFYKDSTA